MKSRVKILLIVISFFMFGLLFIACVSIVTLSSVMLTSSSEDSYGDLIGDTVEEQVWFFLISNGFTKEATAGIMGNMQDESGIDPTAIQYPSQAAAGICQWQYYNHQSERWLKLKNYAAEKGKEWTDLQSQLEFLIFELRGGDPRCLQILQSRCGGFEDFKQLKNIDTAAEDFLLAFERAKNSDPSSRQDNAKKIYEKYKDMPVPAVITFAGIQDAGTSEKSASGVPRFYQNDYDKVSYGSSNLKNCGCGPSSFSMAASYISGKTITPKDAIDWCGNRYWVSGHGTSWAYFAAASRHFHLGVQIKQVGPGSQGAVMNALKNKKMVISSQRAGLFTRGGHFILLSGITNGGKIMVNDPNKYNAVNKGYNDRLFSWSEINASAKQYFIFQ